MSESYAECLVARKRKPLDVGLKVVLIALTAALLFLFFLTMNFIILVPAVLLGVLSYFFIQRTDVEYEYLYLDRELTIDKIMSKQKRKRDRVFQLDKMEILAPEKSYFLDSYKNRESKTLDYSSGTPNPKRYVMIYNDETQLKVFLEPDADILKCMRNVYPRQVHTD